MLFLEICVQFDNSGLSTNEEAIIKMEKVHHNFQQPYLSFVNITI